jgi:hypothetical protein
MKKAAAVWMFLIFSVSGLAHSDEVHLTIYGNGASDNPLRAAAIARANAAKNCDGAVSAIDVTGTQCFGDGARNPRTCIVHTRALCTVERTKHLKRR